MRFHNRFLFWLVLLSLLWIGLTQAAAQEPKQIPTELLAKIDPRLVKQLINTDDVRANILVEMKAEPDLAAARQQTAILSRREAVMSTLQATADQSQVEVRALLAEAQQQNRAAQVRPLWIVNSVAAEVTWQTIMDLAAREEVARVRLDEVVSLPPVETTAVAQNDTGLQWGVKRIQAEQVWTWLGIDGSGVVVANMDSGVDYLHQDLRTRYRGYRGESLPPEHVGNWFDATADEAQYPIDLNGHGTHTMGTAVAGGGVGVAPGAQWIAVRAFDSNGFGQESWIHAAFQWLLAPNGDPALAPDVVNNSWSNINGSFAAYQDDVQHLLDARIIPVFAAGNSGPNAGSVGSPASYDQAFAVGATNIKDEIADFSSRGPSPWNKTKPDISGPGVTVLSTLPGGRYGDLSGTSMATPHVAGTIALMLQADPALTASEAFDILYNTATPLGNTIPNNNTGRGLLNAFAAVQVAAHAGQIQGQVTDQASGDPIPQATLTLTSHDPNPGFSTTTDVTGHYFWTGISNTYDVEASTFGYAASQVLGIDIVTDTTITQDFALSRLPAGTLSGAITEAGTNAPLSATVTINQTPVSVGTNPANGAYATTLPPDSYTVTVASLGHRVAIVPDVTINVNQTTTLNLALDPAPHILLVDSGLWYNGSQIQYYQQALDELQYYYDTYEVVESSGDAPSTEMLNSYDVVIWSAPDDSPGLVGANDAMAAFLDNGGSLFLSGQDVAFWDGSSVFAPGPYFQEQLKLNLNQDNADSNMVSAVPGALFEGLSFSISGGDGADNQISPDSTTSAAPDHAKMALSYSNGQQAGHQIGNCLPYRAIHLPFGLEGVAQSAERTALLERSLNWFQAGPEMSSFGMLPASETKLTRPGETVNHVVRLRNEAEAGAAGTYSFTVGGHSWNTTFPYTTINLEPCQSAWLTFTVTVPPDADWNDQETLTIETRSTLSPSLVQTISRTTKVVAPILLVDDDRWYDFEDAFMQSLTNSDFTFDRWNVQADGSPPLSRLSDYPVVVWFTGYDWFDPITSDEEIALQAYLDNGGRLFLSGHEYIYNLPDNEPSDFARAYLGIDSHSETLSSTIAVGLTGDPVGNQLGEFALVFPPGYQNFTDSITPTATASAAMRNEFYVPNAITNQGQSAEAWHTAFFAYGPELLDDPSRELLLRRVVGWLSWLGKSSLSADVGVAADDDEIGYTAVLKNDGLTAIDTATFTATFPPPLSLLPGQTTGGATESGGQVIWQGPLAKGQAITFTYRASVDDDVPYGTMSEQVSWFGIEDHDILFDRVAAVPVNAPSWSTSLLSTSSEVLNLDDLITYTLHLTNTGVVDAPVVTVTSRIPTHVELIPNSISQNAAVSGAGQLEGDTITWVTPIVLGDQATFTYVARLVSIPGSFKLPIIFTIDDGFLHDQRWLKDTIVKPYELYFPIIAK